jgi:type III secretory pathway lipoprotein EscJ
MSRLALFLSIFIFSLFITGCKKETSLLSNLDQYRTNKIISTLQQHGINSTKVANKKGNAYSIMIDSAKLAEATTILNAVGPFTPAHAPQDPCAFKGLIATPSENVLVESFDFKVT